MRALSRHHGPVRRRQKLGQEVMMEAILSAVYLCCSIQKHLLAETRFQILLYIWCLTLRHFYPPFVCLDHDSYFVKLFEWFKV